MMKYFITAMMCMFFGSAYVLAGDAEETQMLETKKCVACDLNNAWFESAALRKADFSGANLYRANLEYADLRGANFTGANQVMQGCVEQTLLAQYSTVRP